MDGEVKGGMGYGRGGEGGHGNVEREVKEGMGIWKGC